MIQKGFLFAALIAVLLTTAWTSRVDEGSGDKRLSSVGFFKSLVTSTYGRNLLGDDDDGGRKRGGGGDDDDGGRKRGGGDDDDDSGSKRNKGGDDDDGGRKRGGGDDDDDSGSKRNKGGDDDDDGGRKRGGGDDDDDGGRRKSGGDDDDDNNGGKRNKGDDDGRRRKPLPRIRPPFPRRRTKGSSSFTYLRGVLRIVVYGNGHACYVKIHQRGMSYRQQFGDTTRTSAFIRLFGYGTCRAGARGIAYGYAKASVLAEAYANSSDCMTNVLAEVITKTRDLDPNDGITAIVRGAAGGEAMAVCY